MTLGPAFLSRIAAKQIETVMLAGCGGGFDFVHSMLLVPELVRLGKRVVIGSYSFGDPGRIGAEAPIVFDEAGAIAKLVSAASSPYEHYCPEVHVCSYLDAMYPQQAPHEVYAYYARSFTVPLLRRFYAALVAKHHIDAIVIVDGGSDSLMVGDEEGLGDPIEDCVSVTAVASLEELRERLLVVVGLGCDRYNHVSDAASLRAIAELTASGGFLGGILLQAGCPAFDFYRDCVDHIDARQTFRSVLAGSIIAAAEGTFGSATIPSRLRSRVAAGEIFFWPLMASLWGFDLQAVAHRSLMSDWIRDAETPLDCHLALEAGRAKLGPKIRNVENLPRHEDYKANRPG